MTRDKAIAWAAKHKKNPACQTDWHDSKPRYFWFESTPLDSEIPQAIHQNLSNQEATYLSEHEAREDLIQAIMKLPDEYEVGWED